MKSISIFEIIKVGIGPSSSHTMGPWIAAQQFINYIKTRYNLNELSEIKTFLYGSLAKTGLGHGTDIAIMMGLSNKDYRTFNTDKIFQEVNQIKQDGFIHIEQSSIIKFDYKDHLVFDRDKSLNFHPNGIQFNAKMKEGRLITKEYFSIGGGFVVKTENEDAEKNYIQAKYPCHSERDILNYCTKFNIRISELIMLNETTWRKESEIRKKALYIWGEMKECIYRGISKSGILPGGLNVRRRAYDLNQYLLNGQKFKSVDEWIGAVKEIPKDYRSVNLWISVFALAVSEENASFGRIVTAPTNGASGVIPAVLMYANCFTPHFDDDKIINFILTAGEIGTLYKKGATISAALGGCQAEIGVSSSMAAGALTEALGGRKEQVFQAAEIAMEHHLGLTCDPVGGLVQIPCIERNIMGAIKAITASTIALENDSSFARLSLDDVIKAMWNTSIDMNVKYKETSEGGLASIPVNVVEC